MLEALGMNAAGAAADNTIGLIAGGVQANRQMKNQRKLMAEQLAIDKFSTSFLQKKIINPAYVSPEASLWSFENEAL